MCLVSGPVCPLQQAEGGALVNWETTCWRAQAGWWRGAGRAVSLDTDILGTVMPQRHFALSTSGELFSCGLVRDCGSGCLKML